VTRNTTIPATSASDDNAKGPRDMDLDTNLKDGPHCEVKTSDMSKEKKSKKDKKKKQKPTVVDPADKSELVASVIAAQDSGMDLDLQTTHTVAQTVGDAPQEKKKEKKKKKSENLKDAAGQSHGHDHGVSAPQVDEITVSDPLSTPSDNPTNGTQETGKKRKAEVEGESEKKKKRRKASGLVVSLSDCHSLTVLRIRQKFQKRQLRTVIPKRLQRVFSLQITHRN